LARAVVGFGIIAVALSAVVFAKGETTKITLVSAALAAPIEITDPGIVKQFQVFSGPGTGGCVADQCVDGTEGFIVDWSSGAVAQKPTGLQSYEVSFYVSDPRSPNQRERDRLAYVVIYEFDSTTSQGFVYLPSAADRWYPLNARSIYRGLEGRWFRAARGWQAAVRPLIAHP
jgi:hypothetical protein